MSFGGLEGKIWVQFPLCTAVPTFSCLNLIVRNLDMTLMKYCILTTYIGTDCL